MCSDCKYIQLTNFEYGGSHITQKSLNSVSKEKVRCIIHVSEEGLRGIDTKTEGEGSLVLFLGTPACEADADQAIQRGARMQNQSALGMFIVPESDETVYPDI